MRAVHTNFAGAQAIRQAGWSTSTMQESLQRYRASARRTLSVWMLQARLGFKPADWLARVPRAANEVFDWTGRTIEEFSWQAAKATASAAVRAIRWRQVALVASAPFVLPREWRGALVRILAYLGAIYALSMIAADFVRQHESAAMLQPAPRPAWIEVDNPWPAFQLSATGHDEDDSVYAIRRHPQGSRKDILSYGDLGNTQRFMTFEIHRAAEGSHFASPAEEIRALGSEQGRVLGMRSGMPIKTKFGPFHTFEFGIGPFGGYNCIGFLRASETPRVQISGLSCSMNLLVERRAIACALDRLTLLSAGNDMEVARLFAHAEQKRTFCDQRDPLLYRTPQRTNDASSSVSSSRLRLRGRVR